MLVASGRSFKCIALEVLDTAILCQSCRSRSARTPSGRSGVIHDDGAGIRPQERALPGDSHSHYSNRLLNCTTSGNNPDTAGSARSPQMKAKDGMWVVCRSKHERRVDSQDDPHSEAKQGSFRFHQPSRRPKFKLPNFEKRPLMEPMLPNVDAVTDAAPENVCTG